MDVGGRTGGAGLARYQVLDLETQTKTYLKRKASPWHPDNYIVAVGWKYQGDGSCSYTYYDKPGRHWAHIPDDVTMLIGFNLKFDLLWQWDNPELKAFFKRGGWIWDCQYVEYLLHGAHQKVHMVSLTDIAPKYGGTAKIDAVKILWEQGVNTSEIPKDLLIDYLVGTAEEVRNGGDIANTEKVFLGQVAHARELGMVTAIRSRMDGLCATIEMEWNGLQIDTDEAKKQLKELRMELIEADEKLNGFIPPLPDGLEFNWGSRTHKSCLIFGGTVKYQRQTTYTDPGTGTLARKVATEDWPLFGGVPIDPAKCAVDEDTGLYLNFDGPQDTFTGGKRKGEAKFKKVKVPGELKVKFQDFFFRFPGYVRGRPEWATKSTDGAGVPLFSTSGETIEALAGTNVPFCETLVRFEALTKELGTYFLMVDAKGNASGMLTCVDPVTRRIHHKLNHTSTVTTRLSSSDPNLQNIPRGDKSNIKRMFISRFLNGSMLEADYSQLEVVVQGVLSGDAQLCEDLRNKIDFHCKRIAIQPKFKKTYEEVVELCKNEDGPEYKKWKKIRTATKVFSFQRSYGAGAALIAASTGMSIEEVEDLIAAEEETYPGIKRFNDRVAKMVADTAEPFRDLDIVSGEWKVYRRGTWQAPTGCLYSFRSWNAPDYMRARGVTDTFSPTEMKNYPVQGTGGEIVQGICGRLWRHFVANDNYGGRALLCNTVHDCVWVDAAPEVRDQAAKDLKRIMESVGDWFQQFGITITVPFPVEVETGPNMLDLKHVA